MPLAGIAAAAALARRDGPATWRAWRRRVVRAMLPLAAAILALNGLFHPGAQTVLWRAGPAALSVEGLAVAAVVASRLGLIVAAVALAAVTTRAAEVAAWLDGTGVPHPLPVLLPVVAGVLPELGRRAADVGEAQRARGLEFRRGRLPRPGALPVLVVPLLAAALDDVEARTRALEARGLGGAGPRAWLDAPGDDPRQRALRRALLALAAAVLVVARWPR